MVFRVYPEGGGYLLKLSRNSVLESFTKIFRHIPIFIEIGQQ
jgi:hypothetical protein